MDKSSSLDPMDHFQKGPLNLLNSSGTDVAIDSHPFHDVNGVFISHDEGLGVVGVPKSLTVERWGECCSDEDQRDEDDALCHSPSDEQKSLVMVEDVEGKNSKEGPVVGTSDFEQSMGEPLSIQPLNQQIESGSRQDELLFFELGRVLCVSMEGREDVVCHLVRNLLTNDASYIQQIQPKPKNKISAKGIRQLKRLQSSINYDHDCSKPKPDVKFIGS